MGKYYSAEDFEKGKRVEIRHDYATHQPEYPRVVPEGHRLVMKLDRGAPFIPPTIYPDVTDPEEFGYFYKQYFEGWWFSYEVRAVPEGISSS